MLYYQWTKSSSWFLNYYICFYTPMLYKSHSWNRWHRWWNNNTKLVCFAISAPIPHSMFQQWFMKRVQLTSGVCQLMCCWLNWTVYTACSKYSVPSAEQQRGNNHREAIWNEMKKGWNTVHKTVRFTWSWCGESPWLSFLSLFYHQM